MRETQKALKRFFGYDQFRPMQEEVVNAILDGKDCMVLMPTGGGKSICFQLPALMMDGVAIVISPLIALMKDQVQALLQNKLPAAYMNSQLSSQDLYKVEEALINGHIKLLYVSPEKLMTQSFNTLMRRIKLSLIAIDEAHCISQWGHDFRPEYTQMGFLKEAFPNVPLVALTATADKITRRDILHQLRLPNPETFVSSFDRPNISIQVEPGQKRIEKIFDFVRSRPKQSGIIYCLARKSCETVAEKLKAKGYSADYYHADMPPARRDKVQDDFIFDRTQIIVATVAFGMGIDKSNVRWVIHYNMPKSMEAYYQEIGRAGRDGLPATAIMFSSFADVMTFRDMINNSEGDAKTKDLKIKKAERVFDYAETPLCRRRTVISYFGETFDRNCGNCDVCRNPPQFVDGTVSAQKALSAVMRTNESVGINMLIDILRGSRRTDLLRAGYHQIKTYGVGTEHRFEDWQFFIVQLIHAGYLEIAYDAGNVLRVTDLGKSVLFEGNKVRLVLPVDKTLAIEAEKPAKKSGVTTKSAEKATDKSPEKTNQKEVRQRELVEQLIGLRRLLSQREGVPPYLIFSDAEIEQIAIKMPFTLKRLMDVPGITKGKAETYAGDVCRVVLEFISEMEQSGGVSLTGKTIALTFWMFGQGLSIEEIATNRGLSPTTVEGHLAEVYAEGIDVQTNKFVAPEAIDQVKGALHLFQKPYTMRAIESHFEGRYTMSEIKWALADAERDLLLAV